jgi:hypothetical protein
MITVRAQLIKVGGHNTSFGVDVEQSRNVTTRLTFGGLRIHGNCYVFC